jgi:hypothetical protein
VGNLRERDHLEERGGERSIILRVGFRGWVGGGGMDWIDWTQDRNRWRAHVYAVMNRRLP